MGTTPEACESEATADPRPDQFRNVMGGTGDTVVAPAAETVKVLC